MQLLHGDALNLGFWTERLWVFCRRIFIDSTPEFFPNLARLPVTPSPSSPCVFWLLSDAAITPCEEWPVPGFLISPAGNIFSASISTAALAPCVSASSFCACASPRRCSFPPTSPTTPLCLGYWHLTRSMFIFIRWHLSLLCGLKAPSWTPITHQPLLR